MAHTKVKVIEIVKDQFLQRKEKEATAAVKRICPNCGPVKLYRTADGKIGFQARLGVVAGERKVLDEAYRAVMQVLGVKRGRRPGEKTVQTKLRLPQPAYLALKQAAALSNSTISALVARLVTTALPFSSHGAH